MYEKETIERKMEVLIAVYSNDMQKIAQEMQEVKDYKDLASLYEESAKLIRKLDKDTKGLEDGK